MSKRRLSRSAPRSRSGPRTRSSTTLAFQRSLLRWNDLRRLRKGLVRARHHTLRSGANRINESDRHGAHGIGLSLVNRSTRAALPLIFIALLLLIGRRYTLQQFDVEKILRGQVIPQLEAQYNTKIEVGAVQSDWLNRVIVHDVVIGRDLASPIGALAILQTATLSLDIVGLALRRVTPLEAVNAITLDEPQAFFKKDAKGHSNWQDFLSEKQLAGEKWRGQIVIQEGRFWYEDHSLKSASGKITLADARGVKGQAIFNGAGPVQFAAQARETYLGPQKVKLLGIGAKGALGPDADWANADLALPPLPAPLVADYAFPKGDVTAQSGTLKVNVTIAWDKNLPPAAQISARGQFFAQSVSLSAKQALEPGTNRPIPITNINGPVSFDNDTLETRGAVLTALNSNWRTAGTISLLAEPLFDVVVQSDSADTMRLIRVAKSGPLKNNRDAQQTNLSAGRAQIDLHLTGDQNGAKFSGTVGLPNFAASHPNYGRARSSLVRAFLNGSGNARGVQITTRLSAPQLNAQHARWGKWQSASFGGDFQLAATQNTRARIEGLFQSGAVVLDSNGARARISALGGHIKLAATSSPQIQVNGLQMRDVRGALGRDALRAATINADLKLAGEKWQGTFRSSDIAALVARNAGSAASFSGQFSGSGLDFAQARVRGDFRATRLVARASGQGTVRAANLTGAAFWVGNGTRHQNLPGGRLWGRANLQNASGALAKVAGAGSISGRAARADILGRWANFRGAQPAAADVTLVAFAGKSGRYGTVSGQNLRLIAASPHAPARWSGQAIAGALDVSKVNLAALSPEAAQEIRNIGTLSGKINFANAGRGQMPALSGNVRLSRVTLRDVNFRDVSASVRFDGKRLRLGEAVAQSDVGALSGNVETILTADGLPDLNGFKFTFGTQNLTVNASQINPYLKAQNLQASGTATGSLHLSSTGAANTYQARFDLQMPTAALRPLADPRPPATASLTTARVRGSGMVRFINAADWQFSGETVLAAQNASFDGKLRDETAETLDGFGAPLWLHGSRGDALRISLRGSLTQDKNGLAPRMAGDVEMANINLPLPTPYSKPLSLREARAEFVAQPDAVNLSRLTAYSFNGQINGHATLALDENRAVRGQLLAEKMDVSQVRAWLAPLLKKSEDDWTMRGTAFLQTDFSGTLENLNSKVQARLYDGAVRWQEIDVPLDVVRTAFSLELPNWKTVPIESLAVWSRGARFSTNGTLTRPVAALGESEDLLNIGLDLKATLTDLRATRLNEIPSLADVQKEAGIDGLVSADLQIKGSGRKPEIQGRTALRLAQAFGISIGEAQSDLTASLSEKGPSFEMKKITGTVEGSAFEGSFAADYARNLWQGKFVTAGLSPAFLLRATDDLNNLKNPPPKTGTQVKFPLRTLPVRGALAANISLSGKLNDRTAKEALQNTLGTVQVRADDLRWRGLPLGTVNAVLTLQNGLLQTRQLQLTREVAANGPLPAGKAIWTVSGALPANPDAPGLDAKLSLDDERLSFFFAALEEARDALKLRAVTIPLLDQAVSAIKKLPPQLNGKVSLVAAIKGRLSKPMVKVENLALREAHAQGPLGSDRALPTLDAAFDYDGKTVTIQNAALRLTGEKLPNGEAADDTVLRIAEGGKFTPGGDVELQARVINANLSQLAPWVPSLRDETGASKLTGEVQQFAFEVSGPMENPRINGAITAQNINFSKYTIDLLRIARFDIADGFFQIERPNLTVTKGAFQSSAAWGRIPWSWKQPGPVLNAPMEVHLPLGRDDLGALAGTFIPALARADAEAFSGSIDISGTAEAPRIGGALTISDGRFLIDPKVLPFDAGLTGVTGKISFSETNRVTLSGLDGTGDLTGRLVPPSSIGGRATGNPPAELREVSLPATPATAAIAQMQGKTPEKSAEAARQTQRSTKLGGAFALGGDVRLATDPITGALSPETFTRAVPTLNRHRYNLHLDVRDGSVSTAEIAGLTNINFAAFLQTNDETGKPAAHRVRWMLGAQGTPERKRQGGAVYALGALELSPNFAGSPEQLSRSRVRLLDNIADFERFAVYRQIAAPAALGAFKGSQPARVTFKSFLLNVKGMATGQIDGTLSLDNRAPRSRILPAKPRPSVAARVSASRAAMGARGSNEFANQFPGALLQETQQEIQQEVQGALLEKPEDAQRDPLDDSDLLLPGGDGPIRVSGALTLSQATLSGAPVGGVSAGGEMPPGPMLDLSLELGRAVQFSVPNVRANVTGKVEVTGTPADPAVSGTVQIPSGSIRFPTVQARILKGEMRLTAYRDKNTTLLRTLVDINATARGQVGKYTITLEVAGPLDFGSESTQNLRINVTSNPPLSQDQAFAQLLGTRGENLNQEAYKDAIISVVSSPLLSGIEQSLQRILGLDTVALEYRFNEPVTVQVGKSFGDRVYVSYRRVLGDQITSGTGERYTLRMEYRLRNDLQLGLQSSDVSSRLTLEKTWRF